MNLGATVGSSGFQWVPISEWEWLCSDFEMSDTRTYFHCICGVSVMYKAHLIFLFSFSFFFFCRFNDKVKHIKILTKDGCFYIAASRLFKTVLVRYFYSCCSVDCEPLHMILKSRTMRANFGCTMLLGLLLLWYFGQLDVIFGHKLMRVLPLRLAQDLVEYYKQYSLKEGFSSLDTTLQVPYREPSNGSRSISRADSGESLTLPKRQDCQGEALWYLQTQLSITSSQFSIISMHITA